MPDVPATERFLSFCKAALAEDALGKANGTTIDALYRAFLALEESDRPPAPPAVSKPPEPVAKALPAVQSFEDGVYREPWTVYVIRNSVNGVTYVGMASKGFVDRYPGGRWWEEHHNARLTEDVLNFGLTSFRVSIYVAIDEVDMKRLEAELIRAGRLFTYNIRHESSNRPADERGR